MSFLNASIHESVRIIRLFRNRRRCKLVLERVTRQFFSNKLGDRLGNDSNLVPRDKESEFVLEKKRAFLSLFIERYKMNLQILRENLHIKSGLIYRNTAH